MAKWKTFEEAVARIHKRPDGNDSVEFINLDLLGPQPCPAPWWDKEHSYRVARTNNVVQIERLHSGVWSAADVEPPPKPEPVTVRPDPKKVFLIHGRNVEAQKQMRMFLRSLGLIARPFEDIRATLPGSATITDVINKGMNDAQGVIALFTPDEFASLRPEFRKSHDPEKEKQRWQARPNVIFEAGLASGRDPDRVVWVLLGDVELFSDVAGVHILRPRNEVKGDRTTLRNLLGGGMKCDIDQESTEWHDAGDFEACIKALQEVRPRDPFLDEH